MGCDGAGDSLSEPEPPEEGWRRVSGVPATLMETLLVDGDALYAAGEERVYRTMGDGRWTAFAPVPDGYDIATLIRFNGRLFAGTYQGGVFEAAGAGTGWTPRNDGLVGTGAKTVVAMAGRGASLVAGTGGASLFRLNLTDPGAQWQPFRDGIPSNVAWNTSALAVQGARLVAGAGGNGFVYVNTDDNGSWRGVSYDPSVGTFLVLHDLFDTGTSLLGGGTYRLYRSADRGETWSSFELDLGQLGTVRFARSDGLLVALAAKPSGAYLYVSTDDGRTWRQVDTLRGIQAFDVALYEKRLYLARLDGLWAVSVDDLLDRASE